MSGRQGLGAIKSNVASINVNCEPGKPYIVQAKEGEEVVVEAGQEVELHCQSQGGKPPAEIQWWDDAGTRIVADMRGENGTILHRNHDLPSLYFGSYLRFHIKPLILMHYFYFGLIQLQLNDNVHT